MLKHFLALLIVLSSTAALSAQGTTEATDDRPLAFYVNRAQYGVQVEVESVREGSAICVLKSVLLGFVTTDDRGRLRVLTDAHKPGDAFALFAASVETGGKYGMTFDPAHDETVIIPGGPKATIRDLVQARFDDAEALLDEFAWLVPGARDEAEKALDELEIGRRENLKDLSSQADLVIDIVATARGLPGLAASGRPAFTGQDLRQSTLHALKAVCGLEGDPAETARKLVAGKGNGAHSLLAPADLDASTTVPHLEKLNEDGVMESLLAFLLRNDVDHRAQSWAASLATNEGEAKSAAEWVLLDTAEKYHGASWLKEGLTPDLNKSYPAKDGDERLAAKLVDADAWHLYSYISRKQRLPRDGNSELQETRTAAVADLNNRVEFLAVYAYLLATRGSGDDTVKWMRGELKEFAESQTPRLRLGDLREVRGAILQNGGTLSSTLRSALRRR